MGDNGEQDYNVPSLKLWEPTGRNLTQRVIQESFLEEVRGFFFFFLSPLTPATQDSPTEKVLLLPLQMKLLTAR